jgi:hypothetical protein
MLYLVDGRVKRLAERIIDIQRYDPSGCYALELLRFTDGSVYFVEECQELSFKSLCEYLRMQRTKMLMRFNIWFYLVVEEVESDSIF